MVTRTAAQPPVWLPLLPEHTVQKLRFVERATVLKLRPCVYMLSLQHTYAPKPTNGADGLIA